MSFPWDIFDLFFSLTKISSEQRLKKGSDQVFTHFFLSYQKPKKYLNRSKTLNDSKFKLRQKKFNPKKKSFSMTAKLFTICNVLSHTERLTRDHTIKEITAVTRLSEGSIPSCQSICPA